MQSSGDIVNLDLGRPEGPLALSQIRETIAVIIDLP